MNTSLFRKNERIVSQKQIDELFSGNGSHSRAAFPVRAIYAVGGRKEGAVLAQVLVSVPKRRFHHAVDRNRVKRQIRESYRLNKHILLEAIPAEKSVSVAFVWLSDKHLPSAEIEKRVRSLLTHIAQKINS